MWRRLAGTVLATTAIALLVWGALFAPWWHGNPREQGTIIHSKVATIGLLGGEGCNSKGIGRCSTWTHFDRVDDLPFAAAGAAAFAGALAGSAALAVLILFNLWRPDHPRRRRMAAIAAVPLIIGGAGAGAFVQLVPDRVDLPMGDALQIFGAGAGVALLSVLVLGWQRRPRQIPTSVSAPASMNVDVLSMLESGASAGKRASRRSDPAMGYVGEPRKRSGRASAPPTSTAVLPRDARAAVTGSSGGSRTEPRRAPPRKSEPPPRASFDGLPSASFEPRPVPREAPFAPPPVETRSEPAEVVLPPARAHGSPPPQKRVPPPPSVPPPSSPPPPSAGPPLPPPSAGPPLPPPSVGPPLPPPRTAPPTGVNRPKPTLPPPTPPAFPKPALPLPLGVGLPPRPLPSRGVFDLPTPPPSAFDGIDDEPAPPPAPVERPPQRAASPVELTSPDAAPQSRDDGRDATSPDGPGHVRRDSTFSEPTDPDEAPFENPPLPELRPVAALPPSVSAAFAALQKRSPDPTRPPPMSRAPAPPPALAPIPPPPTIPAAPRAGRTTSPASIPSTAAPDLPPPDLAAAASGPVPACPHCESPTRWIEEHLRFYCPTCRMYL